MKYKVLLTGDNKDIISEFFTQLDHDFECVSSSTFSKDLTWHLNYFYPDIVVYCMSSESKDSITSVANAYSQMKKNAIPLVLICDSRDYNSYREISYNECDLLLLKPISAKGIRDKILYYMNEKSDVSIPEIPSQKLTADSLDYDLLMEEISGHSRRKRIMVIDDATIMLKTINEHLRQDYDVATAINGKLARKYLEGKSVDLILLDYEMPEEDGPTVFQSLRNNPLTADIPVIFLTGINDSEKIQKALSLKPAGYLLKPVDKNTLLEKVHEILG